MNNEKRDSMSGTSWVLVVDDEDGVRRIVSRLLQKMGLLVEEAASGLEAAAALTKRDYAAIVSDISMPGMDGLALLREVRQHDHDVPVILVTGKPTFESAVQAIEYGAFHYFVKPFDNDEFRSVVSRAVQFGRIARAKRQAMEVLGKGPQPPGDLAGLASSFERALDHLWMAFQPIIRAKGDHEVYGFEALMRSDEPALPHPGAILEAAERLQRLPELGRLVRQRSAEPCAEQASNVALFVNLHPEDLLDPELDNDKAPLTAMADRVILEITERASLENLDDVHAKLDLLKESGIRIALDDFGTGYSSLQYINNLPLDVIKLDRAFVSQLFVSGKTERMM
ncbi:MAG: hypothetical protein CVU63_21495, partial [Deltaproteobacteria bacterium HGW-Deltaproteobacteria-20]